MSSHTRIAAYKFEMFCATADELNPKAQRSVLHLVPGRADATGVHS